MNRHILTRGAVVAALALAVSACDQGLTQVNVNPNDVTASQASQAMLFPNSVREVVGAIAMPFGTLWDDWAQQTGQIQYAQETFGAVRPSSDDAAFRDWYSPDLADVQKVVDLGTSGGFANVEAVGMIWKAFTFDQITDQWGDVPYSQALQGASNITPKYDTQQQIYTGMLANLTTAEGMLGATDPRDDFGGGDIIYNNNWDEWMKFANSLRMRLAMRLSEVDPTTAAQEFAAAYNAGGFTSNADNAQLVWTSNYGNPWWANCLCGGGSRDDNGVSKTLVDTLLSLQDPRIKFYAEPSPDTVSSDWDGTYDGVGYLGRTNGKSGEDHPYGAYSRIGNYWRANGQYTPSIIMDYSEVLFLEAEAALRGWIPGDPGTFYTDAVKAAFDMYTVTNYPTAPTTADRDAYLQNPRVAWAGGANGAGTAAPGFAQIQLQKWISLYMVGMEAWSNWRRVHIPDLKPGPDLVGTLGTIPLRLSYPSSEVNLNKTNLDAAITNQGQGGKVTMATPMWWQPGG